MVCAMCCPRGSLTCRTGLVMLPSRSGVGCPLLPVGKFQKQKLGEKIKGVFYSKAAQSGRMAASCPTAQPFWNTQRRTRPPSARLVQGRARSSCSRLQILSFRNRRRLQHNPSSDLACSLLQSGFRFLPGVCIGGLFHHLPRGVLDQKRLTSPASPMPQVHVSPFPWFESLGPNVCGFWESPAPGKVQPSRQCCPFPKLD